ncbi:MAG TPA: GAF and ANTAR domain-containing protein [Acidimicrobiales bacterium]|nr:GAF and ANTAR domain-containing protein [Acidimicrobiales bacterium]
MASNQDPGPVDPASVLGISETLETTLDKIVESALQQIVELVCAALDSCSMAGVTLLDPSGPHTVVATNEATERVDAFQYEVESGPCLDAYRNQVMHRVDSTEKDDRWPAFFELARSEGVRSVLSYPLVVHNDGIGALNLYGEREYAFDKEDERIGQAFATHATITLTHARGSWRNGKARQNLERALQTRGVIEQAKGILMARTGTDADQAFEALRRASQRSNRKVSDLAQEIVASTSGNVQVSE